MIVLSQQVKYTDYSLANARKLPNNENQANISVTNTTKSISADSPSIAQRKVTTEQQANNELTATLYKVRDTIKNNLASFESTLITAINDNLINRLKRLINELTKPKNNLDSINNCVLFALDKIENSIPELQTKIDKNILLNNSIPSFIKNIPEREEIVSEIIKLATEYKELKFILSSILNDLEKLTKTGVDIISSAKFDLLTPTETVALETIILRKLFESTTPLHDKLIALLYEIKIEKKLDAIKQQFQQQQQNRSACKTETITINNFLEENKHYIRDISINIISAMLDLTRVINGLYNLDFG